MLVQKPAILRYSSPALPPDPASGEYLTGFKGETRRDHAFAYVEKEGTPRPLVFQLDSLRHVGFAQVDVLHKKVCFAAFGAVKAR